MSNLTRRTLIGSTAVALAAPSIVRAQNPAEVKVGLIVPLSGLYARPAAVMKMGAEIAIDDVNAAGGIKALGGAKLKLVPIDCGDSVEKAKNAAQRMVAQETDLVAATGAYLSSFTLAVTEVTERAQLPVLTLSYSDLLVERGFKYIFQTAATASSQSAQGLPELMKLAESASGKRPKTVAIVMDNTATSVATAKALKEKLFKELGLELVVDEVWTPPLSDATPLIQKVRAARPDLLFANAERGLGREAPRREAERVRPRPGPRPDHLVLDHHRRARRAPERLAAGDAGRDDDRGQLGLQGTRTADRRGSRRATTSPGRPRTSSRPMATSG